MESTFIKNYKAQQRAQQAANMADMVGEAKAFTSTDPATRATAPGAGLGLAAPSPYDLTGAYKIQPKAMTPEMQAHEQALITQGRMDDLYKNTQGLASHLSPDVVAGMERNAINAPTYQSNQAQRGLTNGYYGGGHMGGYGDAAMDVNRQMADAQRDTSINQLHTDVAKYQDAFDTGKANLLHSIATSDPTFQNYDNLYTQGQNFANQDRAYNADQQHLASANQSALVGGSLSAAGQLLGNPTAMAGLGSAIGSVAGPIGTAIGTGAGYLSGLAGNALGLGKPPTPAPAQYNPNDTASAPRYGLASVPNGADKPILGNGQPKRFGLFGGV